MTNGADESCSCMKLNLIILTALIVLCAGCPEQRVHVRNNSAVWANSGKTLYSNDYNPSAGAAMYPFIMGGTDVSIPSEAALNRYQQAGYLQGFTVAELERLYRAEGIVFTPQDVRGIPGKHVLEGGKSLLPPLPGTIGYPRVFCQPAAPYRPGSRELVDAVARMRETSPAIRSPRRPDANFSDRDGSIPDREIRENQR